MIVLGSDFMTEKWMEKSLRHWQDDGKVEAVRPVSGGDINEAYYVRTSNHEYFVKRNPKMDLSFFEVEAEGLRQMKETKTIDVPFVYGVLEDDNIPMLWLDWVQGEKTEKTDIWLGERLAALHLSKAEGYGYPSSTYIGKLKQNNTVTDNWVTYYRDYRLMGQVTLGKSNGRISGNREKMLMHLLENIEQWIPKTPLPSILHGDLWGGNWITGSNGKPHLIDPSIFYGDHEMEIAFTELFGGFSRVFYDSYQSVYPLTKDYEDRKELYQLFYLLVHLNMFGEMYGTSVDRILKKYVT